MSDDEEGNEDNTFQVAVRFLICGLGRVVQFDERPGSEQWPNAI